MLDSRVHTQQQGQVRGLVPGVHGGLDHRLPRHVHVHQGEDGLLALKGHRERHGLLTIGGGVNYRSKAYSDGNNPVTGDAFRFQQDGYTLVALMARYAVTPQLQLQANVDNLFDKKFYSNMGSFSQYRYGAPRNFTIGATYRF